MDDYGHGPFILRLQDVSKRLVRRNTNDKVVKYAAARNLIYNTNPADRNLGYQYVHELLAKYPEWASPHGLQGFIYYKRWQATKSKADADMGIAEYQQFLRLGASPDKEFSRRIQGIIEEMQKA